MSVRFGIFDHMERRTDVVLGQQYDERLELLARADALGFWCYHLAEHHQEPLSQAPSQSVFLAAAARHTRNLKLGALVYLLPFYHPLRLIEEICMLDHLSGGRLQVGVGRGIAAIEHDFWGHGAAEAQARFDESFEILLAGLAGDVLTHSGAFYSFDRVPIELRPMQQPYPPFWYAGNAQRAGTLGMHFLGGGRIEGLAALGEAYRAAWEAGSGTPGRLAVSGERMVGTVRHVFVADTDAEAEAIGRRAWASYHSHYVRRGWNAGTGPVTTADGASRPAAGGPSLGGNYDLARQLEVALVGSPVTIAAYLARYRAAAGTVNYFVGAFHWGDLTHAEALHSLELFATAAGLNAPEPQAATSAS